MAASYFDKLSIQNAQNMLAINRAKQEVQKQGRALPCRVTAVNGAIVTVEFEMDTSPWTLPAITIPKAESPWIRMPTQIGDKGVTMPSDAYLGGISGLGGGTADFRQRGNLAALVFVPVSNTGSPPIDQNAAQVQGPNGAIIRTTEGTTSSIVTDKNGTTITWSGFSMVLNSQGVTINAPLILNGGMLQNPTSWGVNDNDGIAVFNYPIKTPEVILPNGNVNPHTHIDSQGGETSTMRN